MWDTNWVCVAVSIGGCEEPGQPQSQGQGLVLQGIDPSVVRVIWVARDIRPPKEGVGLS